MISDPVLVGANFCINYRQFTATTGNAPTHNPHLDPGVIKFTDQGTPRISLDKEKETNTVMEEGQRHDSLVALQGTGKMACVGLSRHHEGSSSPRFPCV